MVVSLHHLDKQVLPYTFLYVNSPCLMVCEPGSSVKESLMHEETCRESRALCVSWHTGEQCAFGLFICSLSFARVLQCLLIVAHLHSMLYLVKLTCLGLYVKLPDMPLFINLSLSLSLYLFICLPVSPSLSLHVCCLYFNLVDLHISVLFSEVCIICHLAFSLFFLKLLTLDARNRTPGLRLNTRSTNWAPTLAPSLSICCLLSVSLVVALHRLMLSVSTLTLLLPFKKLRSTWNRAQWLLGFSCSLEATAMFRSGCQVARAL